jgi:hypothetical protein
MIRRLLALCFLALVADPARAETARPVVVFDVEFLNTSAEATRPDELDRIRRLGDALKAALAKSGQYRIVDVAPARDKLAHLPSPRECNGCERDIAKGLGAELAAIVWVQKVSNLILSMNIEIEDVATGKLTKAGSIDIRGNDDESWDRGLKFLLEEHVFDDRP